jgi:YD repeat-containing protein
MRSGHRIGRPSWLVCLSLILLGAAPAALRAQVAEEPIPVAGLQRDQAYFGLFGFEHIDTGSGNLLLTFTDWQFPGYNGMDLVFQRTFNSANGWTFGLAAFPMKVVRPDGPSGSPPDFLDLTGYPSIRTSDGGLQRTWWNGDAVEPVFVTADFWRYHVQGRRLELPNGVECFYDPSGALVVVQDRFANRIEIANAPIGSEAYPTLIRQRLGDGQVRELALSYVTSGDPPDPHVLLTAATFGTRSWTYQYGGPAGTHLVGATPPAGPGWSFALEQVPDTAPVLTVTVPQGGDVVYTFLDAPSGDPHVNVLTRRETLEEGTTTSVWTVEFEDEGTTPPAYRRVLDGPLGVRLVYGYGAGPAEESGSVLQWREVRDATTGTLMEREDLTYAATQLTDVSGAVRNLVTGATLVRGGQIYATTFFYRNGDSTGRFADYGRPWSTREVGDAGTRDSSRTFNYGLSGYLVDRIASATTTVAGESATASWTYNADTGFVESATQSGITTTYAADPDTGAVARVTDAHGHTTSFTYEWGVVKSIATPLHTTTRTINADGTVASVTRRGSTTSYEYDALGRLVWAKPPLGYWTETRYDGAAARWVQVRRGDGSSEPAQTTTSFDAFGRVVATEDGVGVKTRAAYDALGRTVYQSLPYTTTEAGRVYRYDVLGRVSEIETGDGKKVSYAYSNGSDVTVTDQEGRDTFRDLAGFGSPAGARLVGVLDAENQTWTYTYNVLDRLTRVNQPGGPPREWQYTGGFLTREVHPESGETTYTYQAGRLATKTTARGTVAFGYDANDRLTLVDAPGTVHDVTFQYDESDNRTAIQNSFVSTAFEYDLANRLIRRRDTLAGQPERQTQYTYDGWDNVSTITYPSGTLVTYAYDRQNRVTSVSRGAEPRLVAQVLDYHPSGRPSRLRFGNGIEETYTFDPGRHWLQEIAGGPVQPPTRPSTGSRRRRWAGGRPRTGTAGTTAARCGCCPTGPTSSITGSVSTRSTLARRRLAGCATTSISGAGWPAACHAGDAHGPQNPAATARHRLPRPCGRHRRCVGRARADPSALVHGIHRRPAASGGHRQGAAPHRTARVRGRAPGAGRPLGRDLD